MWFGRIKRQMAWNIVPHLVRISHDLSMGNAATFTEASDAMLVAYLPWHGSIQNWGCILTLSCTETSNYHQIHNDYQMFETDNSSRHIGPFSSRTSKHWMDHLQGNPYICRSKTVRYPRFPIPICSQHSRPGSWQAVDALLEPKHPWAEAGDRLVDAWKWVHVGDLLTNLVFKWESWWNRMDTLW